MPHYRLVATIRSAHGHIVAERTAHFHVLEDEAVRLLRDARHELREAGRDVEMAAEDVAEALDDGFRALRTDSRGG
jgi:hypothetical protein